MTTTKLFILTSQDRTRMRKRILDALGRGHRNAITGSDLAHILRESDDRRIRLLIRELIAEGIPIASSVVQPMGFYIADDGNEAAVYIRVLKGRIKEDTKRLEDFEKAVASYSPPEQGQLL